jgi:transposase
MLDVQIEYLPHYSSNLNPIEEAFSKIKHWIHCHQDYYSKITNDGILYDMYEVLDIITPDDAEGYFMPAGHF